MQQSIVKFYCFVVQTLLNMFRALLCTSSGARQTAVAASGFRMNVEVDVLTNRPRLRTRPPPHSYGNQRLQRHFDGLLMMGIIMPETCWAVSVRQSNKILRLIVTSSWVFYLSHWPLFETCFPGTSFPVSETCRGPLALPIFQRVIFYFGGIWNRVFTLTNHVRWMIWRKSSARKFVRSIVSCWPVPWTILKKMAWKLHPKRWYPSYWYF